MDGTSTNGSLGLGVGIVLIALLASSAALAPVASASSHEPIEPGDWVDFYCTLNFVFDGPQDAYIGTAGHCADEGDRAGHDDLGEFGTVVYDSDAVDFALIDVDDKYEGNLRAGVQGHPGTPTGVATPDHTEPGDRLVMSGQGVIVSATQPTRDLRPSVLVEHGASSYQSDGPVVNGDSGAPLVHADTGRALGVVSGYGVFEFPPTTDVGPTVDAALDDLRANGYDVTLRTAG